MTKCNENFERIYTDWGIGRLHTKSKKWCVLFGDAGMHAFCGIYANRRRAKKEITHYLKHGLRTCFHGAYAVIKAAKRQEGDK